MRLKINEWELFQVSWCLFSFLIFSIRKVNSCGKMLNLCASGPQPARLPRTCQPQAPAGTGVLSWWSWNHQTAAVTTCVRPTTAAAPTLISSASGQVISRTHILVCGTLLISLYCVCVPRWWTCNSLGYHFPVCYPATEPHSQTCYDHYYSYLNVT